VFHERINLGEKVFFFNRAEKLEHFKTDEKNSENKNFLSPKNV